MELKSALKYAVLVAAAGGVLAGSALIIKGTFRDTSEEAASSLSYEEASDAFRSTDDALAEKMSLSSEDVRHMGFEQEYETGRKGDSMSFIKQPEKKKEALRQAQNDSSTSSERAGIKPVEAQPKPVAAAKPKRRLKGMDSQPQAGSISGFSLKTEFGGFQKKGSKSLTAKHAADDDEDDEDSGSYEKGDMCAKVCAGSSRAGSASRQSDCKTPNMWLEGMCVDVKKFQACTEKNQACQ